MVIVCNIGNGLLVNIPKQHCQRGRNKVVSCSCIPVQGAIVTRGTDQSMGNKDRNGTRGTVSMLIQRVQ